MIDYAFKSEVIKSGLPNIQKQVSKAFYASHILHTTGEVINCDLTFDEALILSDYYSNNESEAWEEASRINHASYKRVKRLKDRIARMLCSGTCLFLIVVIVPVVVLLSRVYPFGTAFSDHV